MNVQLCTLIHKHAEALLPPSDLASPSVESAAMSPLLPAIVSLHGGLIQASVEMMMRMMVVRMKRMGSCNAEANQSKRDSS